MKICSKCKIEKSLIDFPNCSRNKDGKNCKCKDCCNEVNKKYREDNSINFKIMRKKYYENNITKMREGKKQYYCKHTIEKAKYDITYRFLNKDKIKNYKKEWEKINKTDPIFKIKRNLRRRVHHALKGSYKSDKTFSLIGCSPLFFKEYLESLFTEGMAWDNYGEWHIDHIIPCFTFNLSIEEEQFKCFNYLNQRPLWATENLKRSKKEFKN